MVFDGLESLAEQRLAALDADRIRQDKADLDAAGVAVDYYLLPASFDGGRRALSEFARPEAPVDRAFAPVNLGGNALKGFSQ